MSCTICFERFKGSDDLYSTTCGHIYHFGCMQQWKSRSSSCPQCRVYNPKTHKIYLELDDSDTNTDTTALQAEISECHTKIRTLELELKRSDTSEPTPNKIRDLEETLDDTLAHNARIVEQLKNCETRINNLQSKCTIYDIKIVSLNESIRKLKLEKEHLTENYDNLKNRHSHVQKSPAPPANTQGYLGRLIRQTSLVITGADIHPSSKLPNYILFLAHKMNLHYTRQDIIRASKIDNDSIIVQFRYPRMKEEFCSSEYKLSFHDETEDINFHEILGSVVYDNLFEYALNLKLFGYKSVFRRADKVFTCRNDNEEPIRIHNMEHVDKLINEVK